MKTFKTPKGTELPLMDLKGKAYLQVAHRLVWFRETYPLWSIQTHVSNGLFRAEILDENFRIIATGHKTIQDRQYGAELGETGAIGRALAVAGFGTQFAGEDLEEGDELADAPLNPKSHLEKAVEPAEHRVKASKDSNWVGGPTEPQLKRLYAISKRFGWTTEHVKEYLGSMGLESSKELNQLQYQKICQTIEAYPKGEHGKDNGDSQSSD